MSSPLTLVLFGDCGFVFLDGARQAAQLDQPAVFNERFDVSTSQYLKTSILYYLLQHKNTFFYVFVRSFDFS